MDEIFDQIAETQPLLIVLSAPQKKDPLLPGKITLRKKEEKYFAEELTEKKAFHKNLSPEEVIDYIKEKLSLLSFRQVNLFTQEKEISFRISKKGKILKNVNSKNKTKPTGEKHNREKQYLIRPGDRVPFLVDLGVFTKDFQPVASKYDKFRQINRFIEIVDHAFSDYDKDEISILDFGCGKSYLTFFLYHYFAVLKKKRVSIIGYDLKKDVVENCNALSKKYGYHGLKFVVADVTKDTLTNEKIDFIISLHACDIATDFALNFALERNVPYIFSVPCCQHEICSSIKKGDGEMDVFLSQGIFKERFSALLTDVMRTKILEAEGYKVDVLEFVDFAHSPKNLMLRAKKKKNGKKGDLSTLAHLQEKYGFTQTLYQLRKGKTND